MDDDGAFSLPTHQPKHNIQHSTRPITKHSTNILAMPTKQQKKQQLEGNHQLKRIESHTKPLKVTQNHCWMMKEVQPIPWTGV